MPVVQVALPVPLARNFDYLLPDSLSHAVVGGRVTVPFGKRKATGVVVAIVGQSDFPPDQMKSVLEVLDSESLYPASLWRILLWAAEYYHYPLGEVLFHAMPVLLRQGKAAEEAPIWQWLMTEEEKPRRRKA